MSEGCNSNSLRYKNKNIGICNHYPILNQCFISIPPENVRKSLVFRGYRTGTGLKGVKKS